MQLESQIIGYQLLLEGALSDRRYLKNGRPAKYHKRSVTLGFEISVSPTRDTHERAAAVVEVEVGSGAGAQNACAPTIKTLLPQEKTYNVASITDKSGSIGAGAILGVVNAGGSFLWGRKKFFIVQDQDTLAFHGGVVGPIANCSNIVPTVGSAVERRKFSWRFKPVLGRKYVRAGIRQVFVQIAFPVEPNNAGIGRVKVKSQWVEVDKKTGAIAEAIGSPEQQAETVIPDLVAAPGFQVSEIERAGVGRYRTEVRGTFHPGSIVRVGDKALGEGSVGFHLGPRSLHFEAGFEDLAKSRAWLAERDGEQTELCKTKTNPVGNDICYCSTKNSPEAYSVLEAKVAPSSDEEATIHIKLDKTPPSLMGRSSPAYFARLGAKIVDRDKILLGAAQKELQIRAKRTDLKGVDHIELVAPFYRLCDPPPSKLTFDTYFAVTKVDVVSRNSKEVTLSFFGEHLPGVAVVSPVAAPLVPSPGQKPGKIGDRGTVAFTKLSAKSLDGVETLILRKGTGQPLVVPVPAKAKGKEPQQPKVNAGAALKIGEVGSYTLTGTLLDTVEKVTWSADGKTGELKPVKKSAGSITINLPTAFVAGSKPPRTLKFEFKNGKPATVAVDVVDHRVASTTK